MTSSVPQPSDWFQNGFHRFLEKYLRRHFHAIAVQRCGRPDPSAFQDETLPVLVYSNHPSWWDPLLAHFLTRNLLHPRQFYAPIDAVALEQYRVFRKLGFFGVDLNSSRGAADFLRITTELFDRPNSSLWLTPEGRFSDVRDLDAPLMPGLSHLCAKLNRGIVLPLSMEYVFWEERLPECLIRFGTPASIDEHPQLDKQAWADELTMRLRDNQRELAKLVIARDASPFDNLLSGKKGASGLYDWARRFKSWSTGRPFKASHGEHFE